VLQNEKKLLDCYKWANIINVCTNPTAFLYSNIEVGTRADYQEPAS
jgi:hypothetical protein